MDERGAGGGVRQREQVLDSHGSGPDRREGCFLTDFVHQVLTLQTIDYCYICARESLARCCARHVRACDLQICLARRYPALSAPLLPRPRKSLGIPPRSRALSLRALFPHACAPPGPRSRREFDGADLVG